MNNAAMTMVQTRNLMADSHASHGHVDSAVMDRPHLASPPPPPAPLSKPDLRMLLQKATSRLQCRPRGQPAIDVARLDPDRDKRTGYILVASFHEQQTKASDNLFGLQCWAKTLFVSIVEPFIENSHFVVPLSSDNPDLLRYSDIFNVGVRYMLTAQHMFAPLASWNDFLANAPHRLVVVRFKYLTQQLSNQRRENNESTLHLAVNSEYKEGCDIDTGLSAKVEYLTSVHNFTVIREVCFNFAAGYELTLFQFNRHLYGGLRPKTVSVLMEEWRGLSTLENNKRATLLDACLPSNYLQSVTYSWPSEQLICDAKKYRQQYIQTDSYITLMVRTEKILSINTSREFLVGCLNHTLKVWRALKRSTGIKTTFLSMDIGKYGSDSLVERSKNRYYPFLDLYREFLHKIFGPDATIEKWELGFESVSSKQDMGYIGSLQKTIAAQSRCIVFTGGGTFQRHANYINGRINRGRRRLCSVALHKCSRGI